MLKIIHAKVVTDGCIWENKTVYIENGKIAEISEDDSLPCEETLDTQGAYLSPGFVDLHTHGGGGSDYLDHTVEAFLNAAKLHLAHGTTTIVPTACASTAEETVAFIKTYREAKKTDIGGVFAGVHLEGPYFAPSQGGAQDTKYLKCPSPAEYLPILDMGEDILRWSVAPELRGADALGDELKRRGILASIAHSDATYEEVLEAMRHGYTHVTHLYSGTSTVTRKMGYRSAGIIESAYLIDDMTVEIIADGSHLPAPLLKLIYKIKGPEKIALVTDSMRGAGMSEGESILGSLQNGRRCIIEDGVAKLPDRSAFAGSVATSDLLIRTMITKAEVPLAMAVMMATQTPARIQGLSHKGRLHVGADADIAIFDEDIHVLYTLLGGKLVYSADKRKDEKI